MHDNHGGNIQVITVGDGWPIWTSPVRPGREHDTTALRTHSELLPCPREAGTDLRTLGDLGYEGPQQPASHRRTRKLPTQGHLQALRNISLDPWRIGKIVAAALVLLHTEHDRTT